MRHFYHFFCAAVIFGCLAVAGENRVSAGFPVVYASAQPVVPAVVGYTARRAGLFGRRVVMRPVVAPVAVPAPVVVARPVVVAPPVVVVARPAVTFGFESVAPVTTFFPPPAPVPVPVRSFRPYGAFSPVW
jgi:hypothetical protein